MDLPSTFAEGQRLERLGNAISARAMFTRAVQGGHTAALTALGRSLITMPPFDLANGIGMLKTAAGRGDADAAQLCAVLAGQDTALPDRWNIAFEYLQLAARQGSERAQRELALLADT